MSPRCRGDGKRSGRILVTGAAGFIGSHLCERLLEDGYRVWGLDNFDPFYDPEMKRRNLEVAKRSSAFRLVEGDVRDDVLLGGLFSDVPFDAVIHLAARPGAVSSTADPVACFDVNVTGSLTLLQSMSEHRVQRLVFASSAAVYGSGAISGFTEDLAADRPASPYAASKRAGELLCYSFSSCWGLRALCLRFFSVYGPRQRPDLLFHRLFDLVSSELEFPLSAPVESSRDFVHVCDVVTALSRSTEYLLTTGPEKSAYQILNVGTGVTTTIEEALGHVERVLGRRARIRRTPAVPGDTTMTCADCTKLQAVLDFTPQTMISLGVADFAEWYLGPSGNGKGESAAAEAVTYG